MDTVISITQDEFDTDECGCQTKIMFETFEQKPPVKIIHDFAFYFNVDGDIHKTIRYRVFELEFDEVTRFSHTPKPECGHWYLTTPNCIGHQAFSGQFLESDKICLGFNFYNLILDLNKRAGTLKSSITGKTIILDESVIGEYETPKEDDPLIDHVHISEKPAKIQTSWCIII